MTAREYLTRVRLLDWQANATLERIARDRARLERCTVMLTGMPRGGNSDWTDMVTDIIEEEARMNEQVDAYIDAKREIERVIAKVENPEFRHLLELRYLNYKTWEQIAEAMYVDERTAYRWHTLALRAVKVPEDAANWSQAGDMEAYLENASWAQ